MEISTEVPQKPKIRAVIQSDNLGNICKGLKVSTLQRHLQSCAYGSTVHRVHLGTSLDVCQHLSG